MSTWPRWYPGLQPDSGLDKFQAAVYKETPDRCPQPSRAGGQARGEGVECRRCSLISHEVESLLRFEHQRPEALRRCGLGRACSCWFHPGMLGDVMEAETALATLGVAAGSFQLELESVRGSLTVLARLLLGVRKVPSSPSTCEVLRRPVARVRSFARNSLRGHVELSNTQHVNLTRRVPANVSHKRSIRLAFHLSCVSSQAYSCRHITPEGFQCFLRLLFSALREQAGPCPGIGRLPPGAPNGVHRDGRLVPDPWLQFPRGNAMGCI